MCASFSSGLCPARRADCLRLAGLRGEQLLLSFSPIPKLPRVYPSVSVLPVFEKSTPDAPFFFGGGFLAAATMPAGGSLLGAVVLVRAGPKERHSDGVRRSSSASRRAVIISLWRTLTKILDPVSYTHLTLPTIYSV